MLIMFIFSASVTILENDISGGVISFDTIDIITLSEAVKGNPAGSKVSFRLYSHFITN